MHGHFPRRIIICFNNSAHWTDCYIIVFDSVLLQYAECGAPDLLKRVVHLNLPNPQHAVSPLMRSQKCNPKQLKQGRAERVSGNPY